MNEHFERIRLLEALLFASPTPLGADELARYFPQDLDLEPLLVELQGLYANRGVKLVRVGKAWAFRTAEDLREAMRIEETAVKKLGRVATETLAVIAYHQPITRGEIEEIRGVSLSRGTLDLLLELGWIKPRGRRRSPGKPVTWGTTEAFLDHFGLESLDSLPGFEEMKAAGLIDARPAVTALSARGALFDTDDAVDLEEEGEEESEASPDELLAAEFGAFEDDDDGAEIGGDGIEAGRDEDFDDETPRTDNVIDKV